MKIVEITFSEGKTIQENSYEPRSFHFSIKAELGEGEDVQESFEKIKVEVKKALNDEVLKWTDPQKYVNAKMKEEKNVNIKPF